MTSIEYGELIEGIISRIAAKIGSFELTDFDLGLCPVNEYDWNSKAEWAFGIGSPTDERAVTICCRGEGKETVPGIWPARPDMNDLPDLDARIEYAILEAIDRLRHSSSSNVGMMANEYIQQQESVYRVAGTRVLLDSIVYAYRRGALPESIQRSFPSLALDQVHGALAFYLSHQAEIDKYLAEGESEFDRLGQASRDAYPDWYEKLQRAREEGFASHQS